MSLPSNCQPYRFSESEIFYKDRPLGDPGIIAITTQLQKSSLELLDLAGNEISEVGAHALSDLVRKNDTLQDLHLHHTMKHSFSYTEILVEGLKNNRSIASLSLDLNQLDATDAAPIAELLRSNRTLKSVSLDYNEIGDEGAAVIAAALSMNDSVNYVSLCGNGIGAKGQHALLRCLERNISLRILLVDWSSDQNRRVQNFYSDLNWLGGRKLLRQENVLPCLWAHMLAKVGRSYSNASSMVYYFLREHPSLCGFLQG